MRVLICDDDEDLRTTLEWLLGQSEFEVVTASDGAKCLQILSRAQVDLVLLDLTMPGLSGEETLKKIKADPMLYKIPVVILTANSDDSMREECLRLGAAEYAVKPLNVDALKKLLQKAAHAPVPEKPLDGKPAGNEDALPAEARMEIEAAERRIASTVKMFRTALPGVQQQLGVAMARYPGVAVLSRAGQKLAELEKLLKELSGIVER